MITKEILLRLYEGFSIERWCDFVRPVSLSEADKGAEKLIVAFIIGKFEEKAGHFVDWRRIIYSSFFDFLEKISLCDIKEPIQKILSRDYKDEYLKLLDFVLSTWKPLMDSNLYSLFTIHIGEKARTYKIPQNGLLSQKIYRASSKFATLRELEILTPVNKSGRLDGIRAEILCDLESFLSLKGLQKLLTNQSPLSFLERAESLRFQVRWNQTPRLGASTVMGHSYFTAILTLLLMNEYETPPSDKRLVGTVFCALFHDLAEAVTRDIISPVKSATPRLGGVLKNIERAIIERELVPVMDDAFRAALLYYFSPGAVGDDHLTEFSNRVLIDGKAKAANFGALSSEYNNDNYDAVDGETVKISDRLSALLEAITSIEGGVKTSHLVHGVKTLLTAYKDNEIINGLKPRALFNKIVPDNFF